MSIYLKHLDLKFCISFPNLTQQLLQANLSQFGNLSPEVAVKKIMVEGEGVGSYYDDVIPNITSFVLHHRMGKTFCESTFG